MQKWNGNQFAKIPNDLLIDSKLVNASRGGAFKDSLPLSVPLALPTEALARLKARLVDAATERHKDIVPGSPHVKVRPRAACSHCTSYTAVTHCCCFSPHCLVYCHAL